MRRERTNLKPSMAAALALHLAVAVSGLIVWPWFGKPIEVANVTAVTLTPSAAAPPPPALQAPEEQAASAPEPTPKPAPPAPPPPAPQPRPEPAPEPPKPVPPKPTPAPTPTPKPAPPKPKQESLDLNALASSLDKSPKSQNRTRTRDSLDLNALTSSLESNAKPQASTRGPSRFETALNARNDPGAAQATNDAAQAVGARLNRIWNKSCGVEGFRDLVITVRFHLSIDGQLVGQPEVISSPQPGNSVWVAAADRAKRAVNQAAPFTELPRQTYGQWKTFVANFDGRQACRNS